MFSLFFEILAEPTITAQPGKSPLDHPADGLGDEALLVRGTHRNIQDNIESLRYPVLKIGSGIALIGENFFQTCPEPVRSLKEQPFSASPFTDIGGMR